MLVVLLAAALVTAGWENVNANRREIVEDGRLVWQAELSQPGGFVFEKREGAEGEVCFGDGTVTVRKTNAKGYVVLKAKSFSAVTNAPLRAFGDIEVTEGNYYNAHIFLRCHGRTESFAPCYELASKNFSLGGVEEMWGAVNCAYGMTYRKFAHFRAKEGVVTPMVVLTGEPSSAVIHRWAVEDLDDATAKWRRVYAEKTARDRASERLPEEAFDRIIAADPTNHTAKVAKVGGVTRLLIDGKVAVPTAYRAKGAFGDDLLLETMAGGPVVRQGVRLVIKSLNMGAAREGTPRCYWSPAGYDAVGAVRDIKNSLRLVPDALCILGISCNAYPEFTLKEHPESVWRLKDGRPVVGTLGSCVSDYHDMGVVDTNRWPWVSYAASAWRSAVMANIRQLVDELRRQDLLKRVVGVHLSGYHDGQFYSPYPDYSESAKAEYARYLTEKWQGSKDFESFSKTLGFRAQEDFARAFKEAVGKDAVAIRWCMGPFCGAFDLTAFANSDALDICVPQPGYEIRRPGMATEAKLPFSSFDLHGKMFWYEFDLRTYGALESWAIPGVVATKGLGQSDDVEMWRSVLRKHAGVQVARNCGFWFYDMGGGFFSPPEIADEIGAVVRDFRSVLDRPRTPWKPGVALIADEFGLSAADGESWNGGSRNPYASTLLRRQMILLAAAGVPYDFYLADDVLRNPALVKDYRMLVFGLFRKLDESRARLLRNLARDGRTLLYLAETGVHGDGKATGFEVSYTTNACPHDMVAAPGVPAAYVRSDINAGAVAHFAHPSVLKTPPTGPRCTVRAEAGDEVLARYVGDGAPAIVRRREASVTRVYVAEPAGLSAALFNALAHESGAYVPVEGDGVQVDMNADFASMHALRNGTFRFRLPRSCRVFNLKSRQPERVEGNSFAVTMTAGETCWFVFVAAETLSNGITLPESWPPRGFDSLTREVQRVPYLENRPAVVPIDIGRQLFVDDFLIEKTDLRREWHYPVKYEGNPILKPETPLEINRPTNSTARVTGGGVWWDPTRNVYRMWYEAGWLGTPAYAESDDGLSWRRVNLDVVPGTNRILPEGTPRFDGWVVTPDFAAAEPYANWRLFVRPPGPGAQTASVATSKDGLHWSELRPVGACGDASSLFYNPFRRKWVFSLRNEIGPWGKGGSRIRSYREADDFLAGAEWQFVLGRSTDDVVLWLQPDCLEPRDPALKLLPQLYDITAVAYESLMVGGFTVWKGPENSEIIKNGLPKITDLCFAFSRDGYHFSREDRTPAIASERWASKKWDAGYVRSMPNLLVVQDERILVYYGATAGNTNRLEIGGFSCDLNGSYDQGASGVAILRRDGFASLRPGVGKTQGEIVTRPLRFGGAHLFVNVVLGKGTLRAEATDESGRVFPGFSAADCEPVTGDHVKTCVRWKTADGLAALAGKVVRFRFVLSGTELDGGDFYAFWVSPSLKGESRGYVGGLVK